MLIIMTAKIVLAMIAIVAVATVSIIAGVSSSAPSAQASGQCHLNSGSFGSFHNTICNRHGCHSTGGD
jgi:hypothetical protein